jgi:hypothetical protein
MSNGLSNVLIHGISPLAEIGAATGRSEGWEILKLRSPRMTIRGHVRWAQGTGEQLADRCGGDWVLFHDPELCLTILRCRSTVDIVMAKMLLTT